MCSPDFAAAADFARLSTIAAVCKRPVQLCINRALGSEEECCGSGGASTAAGTMRVSRIACVRTAWAMGVVPAVNGRARLPALTCIRQCRVSLGVSARWHSPHARNDSTDSQPPLPATSLPFPVVALTDVPPPVRSQYCNQLPALASSAASTPPQVSLCGWLQSIRVIGELLFAVLRDHSGTVQLVWEQRAASAAVTAFDFATQLAALPVESVVAVKGALHQRPATDTNSAMQTGQYEVRLSHLYVLSAATAASLPFDLQTPPPNEEVRLTHRYLDLRRPYLQRLLRLRHQLATSLRAQLAAADFIEVETPTLFVSSPEGAREFLVPTRSRGLFYALPQSPQQLKQLLMVGGVDRYYQMARCYRDEGQRSDRQPEFTQLDVEMSFATESDVRRTSEAVVTGALHDCLRWRPTAPLDVRTYREVMERYGVDKPDVRYGYEIVDVTQAVAAAPQTTDHAWQQLVKRGGVVRALKAERLADTLTRKELDALQAKEPLVTVVRVQGDTLDDWKLPASLRTLLAFHPPLQAQLAARVGGLQKGDLLLVSAGLGWRGVCERMGRVRQWLKEAAIQRGVLRLRADDLRLLWVTDCPLFDMNETALLEDDSGVDDEVGWAAGLCSMHHPFTAPHPADMNRLLPALSSLLSTSSSSTTGHRRSLLRALSEVRGQHYDLVCNGIELAGGSIRIHSAPLQHSILALLTQQQPQPRDGTSPLQPFRALLTALTTGAPPHGGIAMGFDRFVAMCGAFVEEREGRGGSGSGDCLPIRDVIAFPKTTTGKDLMYGGPAQVSDEQLREYHIQLTSKQ